MIVNHGRRFSVSDVHSMNRARRRALWNWCYCYMHSGIGGILLSSIRNIAFFCSVEIRTKSSDQFYNHVEAY